MIKPKPLPGLGVTAPTFKSRNNTVCTGTTPLLSKTQGEEEVWRLQNPFKWVPNNANPQVL